MVWCGVVDDTSGGMCGESIVLGFTDGLMVLLIDFTGICF